MASLSFTNVGSVRHNAHRQPSFAISSTYVDVFPGVFLIASANTRDNECVLELVVDANVIDTPDAPSRTESCDSYATIKGFVSDKTLLTDQFIAGEEVTREIAALQTSFRTPKVMKVMREDEGIITTIELVRDYTKAAVGTGDGLEGGSRRSKRRPYVHLFIGTSHGTVLVCNALRGTIMAVALFEPLPPPTTSSGVGKSFTGSGELLRQCQCNDSIVRFVTHVSSTDASLNPNIPQSTWVSNDAPVHALYVVHSSGKTVLLGRKAMNELLEAAEACVEEERPYLAHEWVHNRTFSSFPTAGPGAFFASYVNCFYLLKGVDMYSSMEIRSRQWVVAPTNRCIKDAAFYISCKRDVIDVFSEGTEGRESLIMCGASPALATYTCKEEEGFSVKQAISTVTSVFSGIGQLLLPRRWASADKKSLPNAKPPHVSSCYLNNAFMDGGLIFSVVQVDPSLQWAACYSESAGRIYIYNLMSDTVFQVLKGCRSAEFQWHVMTLGGKRMLLLVVHLLLRHAIEVYSLRLGKRVAARYVAQGCTLLRSASFLSSSKLLLLAPDGSVNRIDVLPWTRQDIQSPQSYDAASGTDVANASQSGAHTAKLFSRVSKCVTGHSRSSFVMPYDILVAALRLPLPNPITQEDLFEAYCFEINELVNITKEKFSPGLFDDASLPITGGADEEDIPQSISAAQCLNYLQLRMVCIENYRRALLLNRESETAYVFRQDSRGEDNNEAVFSLKGEPHATLRRAIEDSLEALIGRSDEELSKNIKNALLPSLTHLIKKRGLIEPTEKDGEVPLLPTPLVIFLKYFYCGGRKLEFLREAVRRYDKDAPSFDGWAEIGDIFFGSGRGVGCFAHQMEAFSALGFQASDASMSALCWLCRMFSTTLKPDCLGALSELILLLKNTSDESFLAGLEAVPCLLSGEYLQKEVAEARVLLLVLLLLIRQYVKPFVADHREPAVVILKRLVALHAMISKCSGSLVTGDFSPTLVPLGHQQLRLNDLLPHDDGDALNFLLFRLYPVPLAEKLCDSIPETHALGEALAGVVHLHWMRSLFISRAPVPWGVGVPWYQGGKWNHNVFSSLVIQPTTRLFQCITGNAASDTMWASAAPPQNLAGLSVLLVTGLALLERELYPLRSEALTFLEESLPPDSNLFEGIYGELINEVHRPLGSRSTRDYFTSCHELLQLCIAMAKQLLGGGDSVCCGRVCSSVAKFLSSTKTFTLPLVPVALQQLLSSLTEEISNDRERLLQKLGEACSFVEVIMLFAFNTLSNLCFPPSTATHFSWAAMYESRESLLCFLPRDCSNDSRERYMQFLDERYMARGELLWSVTFAEMSNAHCLVNDEFVEVLSDALGLRQVVGDLHLLVLFDVISKLLFPSVDVNRILSKVASHHLASLLATMNFILIVNYCYRHLANVKESIPTSNRHEKQRMALLLQSMDSAMSGECCRWMCLNESSTDSIENRTYCVEIGGGQPLAYRLLASTRWFDVDRRSAVEKRVSDILLNPEDREQLRDFHQLLFILGRTAAKGASLLESELRGVAYDLPRVAKTLSTVI
uniref:Rab3-GAP regulatory subunit N-terminal domain-containing protein n=1 Tax=Trypanosoma congolense (strain IL3000) TaxID=1068625 RepID=G0UX89_TRYCI|nr:conserved hypothetical protein [Trypanosoma congolense IL3000]